MVTRIGKTVSNRLFLQFSKSKLRKQQTLFMQIFDPQELSKLYKPGHNSAKGDNGQITIIGGSSLFHGAPLFALTTASRIVDMVFLASPEPSVGRVAEQIKSKLFSFIWIPWNDLTSYIEKSDAVLIGPGMMRFGREKLQSDKVTELDKEGEGTKEITMKILKKFQDKKWVIDAGSLQTMDASWIPENSILTPNRKEYQILFGARVKEQESIRVEDVQENAKKYKCIIVLKGPTTIVASANKVVRIEGGNAGLTKGGSGDVMAGLTVALLAKNDPFLSACAGSYVTKLAADILYKKVGTNYNSDDLANEVPLILHKTSQSARDLRK